ncbi:MAG: Yip1 family protein [Acidiferrobacterales bacterium]
MVLEHVWGLFAHPKEEWNTIRDQHCTVTRCYCSHVLLLAAIPTIAGLIGTSQVGWSVAGDTPVKLQFNSALQISITFFFAMLVTVFAVGKMIHWMGQTYNAAQPLAQCIALAAYTATPLFLVGLMLFYPIPWLIFLVGIIALSYTVYLLYLGLPIMMGVSEDRGFLFSSAVLAVGLVMLVGLLATSVILWSAGIGPVFTR